MTLISKALLLGPFYKVLQYNKDSVIDTYSNEISESMLTSKQCNSKLVSRKVTSARCIKLWERKFNCNFDK